MERTARNAISTPQSPHGSPNAHPAHSRELCTDRTLPSTFTVTTNANDGAGKFLPGHSRL